jgi:hypothetical protein
MICPAQRAQLAKYVHSGNYLVLYTTRMALHGLTYFAKILYLWHPAKVVLAT